MDNVLFFHGKTTDNIRFTVAGRTVPLEDGTSNLHIGVSICSAKDQFVKRVGRAKACGRLLAQKGWKTILLGPRDQPLTTEAFIDLVSSLNKLDVSNLQKEFNLYYNG